MFFRDRYDAARQLLPYLNDYRGRNGVILAIPRGGVPIGAFLARDLHFPLDLLMTKKIGHPYNPEYAIGAVGLEDSVIDIRHNGIPEGYIEAETRRIRQELAATYRRFEGSRKPVDIRDRIAIVVDDGIATGRTIQATLTMLRRRRPRRLVVAVPVASPRAVMRIQEAVDNLYCIHTPLAFRGVGQFYADFSPVEDEEVIRLVNTLNVSS
jgi:predicted phosphoribosyltransferase